MGSTLETVVFYFLAAFIIAMSIMTVTTQRIVRSATYLLFVLWDLSRLWFMPVVSSFFMYSPSC